MGDVTMESLPTELVEKILLRLPATAIADAAQNVCRSWRTLVRDPHFACTLFSSRIGGGYLVENLPDPAVRADGCCPRPFFTYVHDIGGLERGTDCAIVSLVARLPPFHLVSQSCDGLVLLIHYEDSSGRRKMSAHLCNPLLGKWITLPERLGEDGDIRYRSTRFAFDVASKKYKVFRLTWLRHPTANDGFLVHCDVLTVSATGDSSTDDAWRRSGMIQFTEFHPYRGDPCPFFRNGILSGSQLHWVVFAGMGLLSVMSIDVQSERIDFSPNLPLNQCHFSSCHPLSINGRLCLVMSVLEPNSIRRFRVCFYGRPESPATDPSWERLTTYERSFDYCCDVISTSPCEERGRGALLFSHIEHWRWISSISQNQQDHLYHDLRTNKIRRLRLPRYNGYEEGRVFDYTPTLLMPGM